MFVLCDVLSVKKIIRVGHCKITMSAKWKSLFIALIRKTSFSYFKKNSSLFTVSFCCLYVCDIVDYLLKEGNNIDIELTSITTIESTTTALDCHCSSADFAVVNYELTSQHRP